MESKESNEEKIPVNPVDILLKEYAKIANAKETNEWTKIKTNRKEAQIILTILYTTCMHSICYSLTRTGTGK